MVGLSSINPEPAIGLDIPCFVFFVFMDGLYLRANSFSFWRKPIF